MRQQPPPATVQTGFKGNTVEVQSIRGQEPSILVFGFYEYENGSIPTPMTPSAARILAAILVAAANEAEMDR